MDYEKLVLKHPVRNIKYEKSRIEYLNSFDGIKNDFIKAKNKIIDKINEFSFNLDKCEKTIYTNYGIINTNKEYLFVGRDINCDIRLNNYDRNISRIQCILIFTIDNIYILDEWSLCGINIKNRGNKNKKLEHTHPDDRKLLKFDINETFILNFKGDELIVGKNECFICCENPKSIKFNCGHSVCNKCSKKIYKCPYCRDNINKRSFSQCD